jgi:hypothetical protein
MNAKDVVPQNTRNARKQAVIEILPSILATLRSYSHIGLDFQPTVRTREIWIIRGTLVPIAGNTSAPKAP